MTQKLSELVRDGLTCKQFPSIKTKVQIRSAASKKAWKVRKRQAQAREAARAEAEAGKEAA